jgi:bifunctional DNA-binding transcriptional regulator/antitoxin component of YhaV-PrlF toxin-antitoxin module
MLTTNINAGDGQMEKRRINISSKRQITIPAKYFDSLGLDKELDCIYSKDMLILLPVKKEDPAFAEEILQDLIEQGFSGEKLLTEFKKANRKVRPAVEKLIEEADEIAKAASVNYIDPTDDIFGDEERLKTLPVDLVDMYEDIFHFTRSEKIKFKPRNVGKMSDKIRVSSKTNKSKGRSGNISVSGKFKKGIARAGNVLQISGNQEALKHSAVFPVKLPAFFIKLTTDVGDIIYEPFNGSGTSLMAAEQLGRNCYAMELSPGYCDLTVKRLYLIHG